MGNPLVLLDALIGYAGLDASGRSNKVTINLDASVHNISTFSADGWAKSAGGAKSCDGGFGGLVDYGPGALDPILFTEVTSDVATPFTFAVGRTAGDIAYLIEALAHEYKPTQVWDTAMTFEAAFTTRRRGASSAPGRGFLIAGDPAAGRTTTLVTGTVQIPEAARLRLFAHIPGTSPTGTVTPRIDWARVGGGASGTAVGNATNPGNADVIEIEWPDPGNDLDVGATLTVASGPTYGYIVAAAGVPAA